MNILVVDDKTNVGEYISNLLTPLGYNVDTAVNGLDGFEKAQKTSFQLYIVDHLMPLMNGITLTKNLKKLPVSANMPVLFMTTKSKDMIEKLPEFKLFDEVITKPLNEDNFMSIVNRLLGNTSKEIAV